MFASNLLHESTVCKLTLPPPNFNFLILSAKMGLIIFCGTIARILEDDRRYKAR